MPSVAYRQATQEDADFLYRLHRAALRNYVVQTWGEWDEGWQKTQFLERFCAEYSLILIVEGQDVGVLRLERGPDEWFVAVLEILPQWQGKGIGTSVLQSILKEAAVRQKPVALQVLKVNPARRLYERHGFRSVGETPTHIKMRAWPPLVAEEAQARVVEKVVAYITWQDQLLVFRHTGHPEAGIQVPAGTLEPSENPAEAVLREAHEETGLSALRLVRFLGTREHNVVSSGCQQLQRRHFFHLETDGRSPPTWQHWEIDPSDKSEPVEFELLWVPLRGELPWLSGALGEMVPLLLEKLTDSAKDGVG